MPTFDRFFNRGDYRLYYRHRLVNPSAPTYVLLHGWSGNNTCFIALEKLLNDAGINTVTPDFRGHGLSSKHRRRKDYVWAEFVADLHVLLKKLDLKNVILFGYSAGGTIALKHEIKYPGLVDQIISVSANARNPFKNWKIGWLSPAAVGILLTGATFLKIDRRKTYKNLDLLKINGYWASVYGGLQSMPLDVNMWLLTTYAKIDLTDVDRIKVPVYVVRGSNDTLFSAKEAADLVKKIPQAKMVTVKGAGHYLVTHHEKKLLEAVDQLIKPAN